MPERFNGRSEMTSIGFEKSAVPRFADQVSNALECDKFDTPRLIFPLDAKNET